MQCLQMSELMTWHAGPPQFAQAPEVGASAEAEDMALEALKCNY